MLIRNLRRMLQDAFKSIFRNGFMSVASILVSVACLFIFGVFIMLTINMNYMGEQIAGQCQIEVNIDETITDGAKIEQIKNEISKNEFVKEISFVSGEERYEEYKKGIPKEQQEFFAGVPADIISDLIKVTLTDISQTKQVSNYIEKIDGVSWVKRFEGLSTTIQKATNIVRNISIWIVIIFAIISIFIISNTIKLTVHNRRKEINIMKYVGATDSFIRGPFVTEGMLVGFIAAIVAFFLTQTAYNSILGLIGNSATSTSSIVSFKSFGDMALIVSLGYLIIGLGLGALGSSVSMRKYLKV
ncbi:MAG: ABC transporter permease [Ruminococcaceae bacterium]|nr:ABC transporter permease [Oscillospiraceae bacterium]